MRVKTNLLYTVALCATMVMAAESKAANVFWAGGDGAFNDAANWGGGVPTVADQAIMENGATTTINDAHDTANFRVNNGSTLVIETGATLTSTGWSFIGKSGGVSGTGTAPATINMSGGLVKLFDPSALRTFMVGHANSGTLNMSGGLFSISGGLRVGTGAGTGTVNLDGGVIEASELLMGPSAALINVTGGVMNIADPAGADLTSAIQAFVDSGNITGNGTAAGVVIAFDSASGVTSFSAAVPEPTSIVLLGLAGSLLAISRRR